MLTTVELSTELLYSFREDAIKVQQTYVKPCPKGFMAAYYWYWNKRKAPG